MAEHWHQKGDGWKWVLGIGVLCLVIWLAWGKFSPNQNLAELAPVAVTVPTLEDPKVSPADQAAAEKEIDRVEAERKATLVKAEEKAKVANARAAKAEKELRDARLAFIARREAAEARGNVSASGSGDSKYGFVSSGLPPNPMTATAPGVPAVKLDGSDVLVPDVLVRAIPGYCEANPVLAAWNGNGWFVRGPEFSTPEATNASVMTKEGGYWRARGMAGQRFHPVQRDEQGLPIWALIEEVWPGLGESFIDRSNRKGPCLLVRS